MKAAKAAATGMGRGEIWDREREARRMRRLTSDTRRLKGRASATGKVGEGGVSTDGKRVTEGT